MMKMGIAKLPVAAVLLLGGLSACATQDYVDKRIAEVNDHINAVDAKATHADQTADTALSTAQAAQASATQANQRIDQLTTQVNSIQQQLQQPPPRTPRG